MPEQGEAKSLGEVLRAMDAETAAPAEVAPEAEPAVEAPAEQAETEQGAEAGGESETAEPKTLKTLHDVAEHLGVDVADLYSLEIPLGGDGEAVTLGKWKDEYQSRTAKVRAEEQALAQARQRAEQDTQATLRKLEERYAEAAALVDDQEQRLLAAERSINWQELRQSDPAEYAARRQEHLEAVQALQARKHKLSASVGEWRAQQAEQQHQALAKTLEVEAQRLLDRIPEWRDPEKARKGRAEMRTYLADTYGYTDEQIGQVADHRLVDIVRKAMAFEAISRAKPEQKRAVKIGDKVLTPGARQTRDDARAEDLTAAKERLRKTGSKADFGKFLRLLGD